MYIYSPFIPNVEPRYMTAAMWAQAPALYRALTGAVAALERGAAPAAARAAAVAALAAAGAEVEYVSRAVLMTWREGVR